MRLQQAPVGTQTNSHPGIRLLLAAALLVGSTAPASAQYGGVTTYLGDYTGTAASKPARRASTSQSDKIGSVNIEQLVNDMRKGGYVIVLRHGATNANQADTDPFHLDNVGAQRLLSETGRDVAKRVGDSFRALGIPIGEVYSSQFNRAAETALLVSGKSPSTTADLTEGGLVVSPAENARRSNALKSMALVIPESGSNTLIVTHKPNILDAFGKDWFDSREGEASVFKPDGSDKLVVVARVQAADWIRAAGGQ